MLKRLSFACCLLVLLGGGVGVPLLKGAHTASAADIAIAAVVNDEAISNADVEGRVRLALLGTPAQPPPEVIQRLRAQVLRAVIDERIQLQEAARVGVTVDDAEVNKELEKLSAQNGVPPGKLGAFFASRGVPISALKDQIRASLAWTRLVQTKIRPQIVVADDEVDAEITRLQASAKEPHYLVATIVLPVDKPQEEEAVRQTGLRLVEQMARGARFSAVARQFSRDATAASGGDLGWVTLSQLDPAVGSAVQMMKPGTLSPPVRTAQGFQIVMLRDVRQGLEQQGKGPALSSPVAASSSAPRFLTLRQVKLSEASPQAAAKLERLRQQAKNCGDMERLAKEQGDAKNGNLGKVPFNTLPPALKPVLASLPVGQPTGILHNAHGLLFLMVCARDPAVPVAPAAQTVQAPGAPPAPAGKEAPPSPDIMDREKVVNMLGSQKLELQAKRYLRDLIREAYVDVRS